LSLKSKNPQLALVDIREDEELKKFSINGASHIPMSRILQEGWPSASMSTAILFCQSGKRSARCLEHLKSQGIVDMMHINQGLDSLNQSIKW
jgi:rhodanese-related sulfurtransferase